MINLDDVRSEVYLEAELCDDCEKPGDIIVCREDDCSHAYCHGCTPYRMRWVDDDGDFGCCEWCYDRSGG